MSTGDPQYYIQTDGNTSTDGNTVIFTTTNNTSGSTFCVPISYYPPPNNTWNFTASEPDPRHLEIVDEPYGRRKFVKTIRPIDAFDEFEALCPICEGKMVRGTLNTDPFCWHCVVDEILSLVRDKSALKTLKALNAYLEIHITAYNTLNGEEETIIKVVGY